MRYFQGLAQRSGLLAPSSTRASVASTSPDIVEQDVTQTIDAPATSVPREFISSPAPTDAQPTPVVATPAVRNVPAGPPPVSSPILAPPPVHIVTEIFSEAPASSTDEPTPRRLPTSAPIRNARTETPRPTARASAFEAPNIEEVPAVVSGAAPPNAPRASAPNTTTQLTTQNVSISSTTRYETNAYVAPEISEINVENFHSTAPPMHATAAPPVTPRKKAASAPSIDVHIGAIKLDIHQAAPSRPVAATPAPRAPARSDAPRFAPRRYYLSGW